MTGPALRTARLLLASGAVTLLSFGVVACGSDDPADSTGDTSPPSGDTVGGDDYGGTTGGADGAGEDGVVVAQDFSLTDLTVAPGAEFVLDNQGAAPHTLTSDDDGLFDSDQVAAGGQSDPLQAPDEPGTYPFHCEIHDTMQATLTVEG